MENYKFVKKLGSGNMGSVDLVRRDGKLFALKTISKSNRIFRPTFVRREIEAGQILKHHSIESVSTSWEDQENHYLLMNFIKGIDLITLMEARNDSPLTEVMAREIFKQLMDAVLHMHSKGVAHRDLKLDNVMVDSEGNVRVIDFGFCKTGGASHCTDRVGSIEYTAPEMFSKKPYNGYSADVYSIGIILFTLLCGHFPYSKEEIKSIMSGKEVPLNFPVCSVSLNAQNLICRMLETDPRKRIAVEQINQHAWLKRD
eukprot:TRINITY_DN15412_c0_g1_i1.p1 TRINITY_DN15412_c0_g1~~TRINITY_DN15412_c0_g1_i1.p1  ORF type:complete len:257 (+),score=52.76 TRINITY_DN15412_c0_g1_i1:219-989(+)